MPSPLALELNDTEPEPIYLQIAQQLRQRIAIGTLAPGDALPPVRSLADELGCSVGAVARAYSQLHQDNLITTRRGGGTHVAAVTPPPHPWLRTAHLVNTLERHLLDALAQGHSPAEIEAAFGLALARWRTLARLPDSLTPPTASHQLRFVGSHDLALEALFRLAQPFPHALSIPTSFVGSLNGLIALAEGRADLTGVHLIDETAEYNASFVRRLLPGQRAVLIRLATRVVGWIAPAGNPRHLEDWGDLAQPGLRLVNRQPGAGSRVLLDRQLTHLGLSSAHLIGYDRIADTHLALAQTIAQGEAEAGIGIDAAARAMGLDFVPLAEEPYDLVVLADRYPTPAVQVLLSLLRSEEFRHIVAALGGYNLDQSGTEKWLA